MICKRNNILSISDQAIPEQNKKYIRYFFNVPKNVSILEITFSYNNLFSEEKPDLCVFSIAVFDPKGFRGHRMKPSAKGDVILDFWTSKEKASFGALPGDITPGQWFVQIDIRSLTSKTNYELKIFYELDDKSKTTTDLNIIKNDVISDKKGWYKGELHAHSAESDGKLTAEEVVNAAAAYGLDFISLSDHNTISQWYKLSEATIKKIAIIHSLEITNSLGHANIHGISKWINVYIDQQGWSANKAAKEAHRQGGLFCVNHAFSGNLSWRDLTLDWGLVDMEEIYHNLEGVNNLYQLSLWDQHLSQGYKIVGVGGTDSHDPHKGLHKLGNVVTYVYAEELSERGIINGLKLGHTYVSRGPKINFTARTAKGDIARMGETLPFSHQVDLTIQINWNRPLNLFLIKNGLIFGIYEVNSTIDTWKTISISDTDPILGSYYRIELHDKNNKNLNQGTPKRDHTSMQILSNPIFLDCFDNT